MAMHRYPMPTKARAPRPVLVYEDPNPNLPWHLLALSTRTMTSETPVAESRQLSL